jgi:uncharacterized protein (TIGR03437 family)
LVSAGNPARPGETIALYLSGLGLTDPPIPDGTPGPINPPSITQAVDASIDGVDVDVSYAGLAPALIGLYQMNIRIPTSTAPGDAFLDIRGPDAISSMATVPVGGAALAAAEQRSARRDRIRGRPRREAGRAGKASGRTARRVEFPE